MEQLTTATLTQLPQVRALGRHTGRDPLTLFWTASGIELELDRKSTRLNSSHSL